ncbi:MAG TPA: TRAP transporter substrate-binding protein DctP [Polyangiales bacterium]|nr:TRAP transporter substrate-binding protein DctP [Polyangiales bacterium]
MLRRVTVLSTLTALLCFLPGAASPSQAASTRFIRIATLVPRDSDLARSFMKLDKALRNASGGSWGIRLYPGGVAGDEPDVLRKMKIGQMDASIITTTGLSHIVKEIAVLDSPGVIHNYEEFEAVTKAMEGEWTQRFEHAGWKLIGWSEAGQYRWFSRGPIQRPSDLQQRRPWLWPASFILKELYHVVGCNGVPLGVPEVFGALQTNMIDTVISTAAALVALQWHPTLKHVTQQTFGVLINGLVMGDTKWKELPADVAAKLMAESAKLITSERADVREADRRAYENLLKRGYTADAWAPNGYQEYLQVEKQVRERLVNRLYSPELLQRVMSIASNAS